jgi:hypothetical protein
MDEQDHYEYYAYRITEDGISVLLKHDAVVSAKFEDDDIPF